MKLKFIFPALVIAIIWPVSQEVLVHGQDSSPKMGLNTVVKDEIKKDEKAGIKEQDPVECLKKKQNEAREKEQIEIDRLKNELEDLNIQAASSDKTLDLMLKIVNRRKEVKQKLEKLLKKQKKEEQKRFANLKRLKGDIKKRDIQKYQEIISSPFGKDMKADAMKAMGKKYPEMEEIIKAGGIKELPAEKGAKNTIKQKIMEFVLIKPGTFIMGSRFDEPMRDDDEIRHKVTLTKKIRIQATEVTQSQWKEIMGNNPSYFKDCADNCPVERVSWNDCREFIRRLNKREGAAKYRLPTEAEWEYVCRAGGLTAFADGEMTGRRCGHDPILDEMGWYCGNSGKMTHPVGQRQPNKWGIFDMHGNVWEWCEDWYGKYPSGHVTDPSGPSSGRRRVFRGGGWLHNISHCRSANRFRDNPDFSSRYIGFRLVKTP